MKENKRLLFLGIMGVVAIGVVMLLSVPDVHKTYGGSHPARIKSAQAQSLPLNKLDSKVDTQGVVTIEVTPQDLSINNPEWKFDVGLNTHSLELDQDMVEVSVLINEKGEEYKPIRWEGDNSGGHHREGILIFKSITPLPKSIELRIMNIDVPLRSFVWNITS